MDRLSIECFHLPDLKQTLESDPSVYEFELSPEGDSLCIFNDDKGQFQEITHFEYDVFGTGSNALRTGSGATFIISLGIWEAYSLLKGRDCRLTFLRKFL